MLDSRVFSHDPVTGKTVYFHFDEDTEEITFETQTPIGGLLEGAQAARNEVDERANWKGDAHHVSWMPTPILMKMMREHPETEDFQRAIKRWLNDPDNRPFRSRPGRV